MQLQITRDNRPGWAIIQPAGEIDLATVGDLEAALTSSIEEDEDNVALDLAGITFMDSTGLRSLLAAHHALNAEGRRLAVIVNGGPVERLIDITGLKDTLELYPTLDVATG